ncbi:MAG: hypothetical protein ACRCXT_08700 [Paraclostridium sp.]
MIEFMIEWNLQKVIFKENGILDIIDIDVENDKFIYKNLEVDLEQDIEKFLTQELNKKYIQVENL